MQGLFPSFRRARKGAAFVEYIVLVGLIGAIAIFSILVLGETTNRTFSEAQNTLSDRVAPNGTPTGGNGGGTPPPAGPGPLYTATYPPLITFTYVDGAWGPFDAADFEQAHRQMILDDPTVFGLPAFPDIDAACGPAPGGPDPVYDACAASLADVENGIFAAADAAALDLATTTTWTLGAVSDANGILHTYALSGNVLTLDENPLSLGYPTAPGGAVRRDCPGGPLAGLSDTVELVGARPGGTTVMTLQVPLSDGGIC